MKDTAKGAKRLCEIVNDTDNRSMNREVYEEMASEMARNGHRYAETTLMAAARLFVSYATEPLYVNEIKNFLKTHSDELLGKYARAFAGLPGCSEAFGLPAQETAWPAVPYTPKSLAPERTKREKNFDLPKRRKPKNTIKKQARAAAAEKHRERAEQRSEKKERRAKFEEMVRKENGS
ncbi:hypothetical protein PAPHI01_2789, partial [Pancytospora philotis]